MLPEHEEQIVNFLDKVESGDNIEAGQTFSDLMIDKINARLDDMKVGVSNAMFNAEESEEVTITQDEFDALPDDEKAEWSEVPEEVEEEVETVKEYNLWRPKDSGFKASGIGKKKVAAPKPAKPTAPPKPTKPAGK